MFIQVSLSITPLTKNKKIKIKMSIYHVEYVHTGFLI